MRLPAKDVNDLKGRFGTSGRVRFGFELKTDPGFTPPASFTKAAIERRIRISLPLGVHVFYTVVEKTQRSWGAFEDFLSRTVPGSDPHQFLGTALARDAEDGRAQSLRFARFLGLGLMTEHVDLTWFTPLDDLWGRHLSTTGGPLSFAKAAKKKKGKKNFGPDYLAMPFEPMLRAKTGNPLHVLEFKGRTGTLHFSSSSFVSWRKQVKNIRVEDANHRPVATKTWILLFNYACKGLRGARAESTMVVEDPAIEGVELGPDQQVDGIIREHLARQCRSLGYGRLAPFVLEGRRPDPSLLPPVLHIDHPKLGGRHYVGRFMGWLPDGEMSPTMPLVTADGGRLVVFFADRSGEFLELPYAPGVLPFGQAFLGQDASMLLECMKRPSGTRLTGPFDSAQRTEVRLDSADEPEQAVQLLANGSLLARADLVHEGEEAFWASLKA